MALDTGMTRRSVDRVKDLIRPLAIRLSRVEPVQRVAERVSWFALFHDWTARHACEEVATRTELYERVIASAVGALPIWYLEFGVYKGWTIRWWAEHSSHPDSRFVGFDSFEGLPEAWSTLAAGHFSTGGAIPSIDDPRVRFEKGLFSSTVPPFLARETAADRVLIAHLDADLYTSTLLPMLHLAPHLHPGSILLFDEFADYLDEFRAMQVAFQAFPCSYRVLGHTPNWTQVALVVTERESRY